MAKRRQEEEETFVLNDEEVNKTVNVEIPNLIKKISDQMIKMINEKITATVSFEHASGVEKMPKMVKYSTPQPSMAKRRQEESFVLNDEVVVKTVNVEIPNIIQKINDHENKKKEIRTPKFKVGEMSLSIAVYPQDANKNTDGYVGVYLLNEKNEKIQQLSCWLSPAASTTTSTSSSSHAEPKRVLQDQTAPATSTPTAGNSNPSCSLTSSIPDNAASTGSTRTWKAVFSSTMLGPPTRQV